MDIRGPCISMSNIRNNESFAEGRRPAACWISQGLEEAYGKGHGRMADVGDGLCCINPHLAKIYTRISNGISRIHVVAFSLTADLLRWRWRERNENRKSNADNSENIQII